MQLWFLVTDLTAQFVVKAMWLWFLVTDLIAQFAVKAIIFLTIDYVSDNLFSMTNSIFDKTIF